MAVVPVLTVLTCLLHVCRWLPPLREDPEGSGSLPGAGVEAEGAGCKAGHGLGHAGRVPPGQCYAQLVAPLKLRTGHVQPSRMIWTAVCTGTRTMQNLHGLLLHLPP